MTETGLGDFARTDIYAALAPFGITAIRRATGTDAGEEVFLLGAPDYERTDPQEVALAIVDVLPHTKIWVIADNPAWDAEQL